MLKIIEFGLLAVSLLTVLGLIVATPRAADPGDAADAELDAKLPPAGPS
jgi:hypothetical protein